MFCVLHSAILSRAFLRTVCTSFRSFRRCSWTVTMSASSRSTKPSCWSAPPHMTNLPPLPLRWSQCVRSRNGSNRYSQCLPTTPVCIRDLATRFPVYLLYLYGRLGSFISSRDSVLTADILSVRAAREKAAKALSFFPLPASHSPHVPAGASFSPMDTHQHNSGSGGGGNVLASLFALNTKIETLSARVSKALNLPDSTPSLHKPLDPALREKLAEQKSGAALSLPASRAETPLSPAAVSVGTHSPRRPSASLEAPAAAPAPPQAPGGARSSVPATAVSGVKSRALPPISFGSAGADDADAEREPLLRRPLPSPGGSVPPPARHRPSMLRTDAAATAAGVMSADLGSLGVRPGGSGDGRTSPQRVRFSMPSQPDAFGESES